MGCRLIAKRCGETTFRRGIAATLLMVATSAAGLSPSRSVQGAENPFPGRFPAPSLDGGVEWLNTSGEITLKDLRGKIVLLDFWTYCCINCMHILPDLKYLEQKYPNQLVVIGVHAPKFENERDTENIRGAILRYEIAHPVINDANMTVARKYQFSSWPTLVLIDPEGNFVGQQPGEGSRELFDEVIGKMVKFHREKGTLDESPVSFVLERARAKAGPLKFPGKILIDEKNDRLFVSDSNHNRIVISSFDGKLKEIIGSGAIGRTNGDYQAATFDHPQGMTLVDEMLYIADTENHLIRAIDLDRKSVTTLAGTGEQARGPKKGGALLRTQLNSPWAITHLDQTLYICMAGPHQLWAHKLGSSRIEPFAGSAREDILDGSRDDAALAQPSGITTDGKVLYHVDSEGSAVRSVTLGRAGTVTTIVGAHDFPNGRSLFEFGDIDAVGDEARLQHPLGIFYHDGGLFVADTYNHKIKHVDLKTRTCTTWLGTGKSGNGLNPVELSEPADIAIVGDVMFITDTNNHRLLRTDLKSKKTEEFVIQSLTPPPAVEAVAPEEPTSELAMLSEQTVRPGEALTIELTPTLPEGFKLNPLAAQTLRLSAKENQALVADDNLDTKLEGTIEGDVIRWTIPIAATSGSGSFELKVSYAYCRDGTGGVCKFGTARWEVPIRLAPDAAGTAVSLAVKPSN